MKEIDPPPLLKLRKSALFSSGEGLFMAVTLLALGIFFLFPLSTFASGTKYLSPDVVEKTVEVYFHDTPALIPVAECESNFRQYRAPGVVLHGGGGNNMIGVMQINAPVHRTKATSLGYNIDTLSGNLGYAKYLYAHEGITPWIPSSSCWKHKPSPAVATLAVVSQPTKKPFPLIVEKTLQLGSSGESVTILQRILNNAGFAVAEEGDGSKGHETVYFGAKTQSAVEDFQCKNGIVCEGGGGYGDVGPKTREALNMISLGKVVENESVQAVQQAPQEGGTLKDVARQIEDIKKKMNLLTATRGASQNRGVG